MPTTTASKAGLRAAATKRTAKAAQRTPLPAKGAKANIALAAEAVAERKVSKVVKAVPAAAAKPAKAAPAKGKPAKGTPAKGEAGKAAHYEAVMQELGWKTTLTKIDGLHSLLSCRGNEALFLEWLNEAHVGPTSTYTVADHTVKIRNASEMVRIAGIPAAQAKQRHEQVAANRAFVKRPTGPTIRSIPFDVDSATEAEIAEALAGHQIQWHNQYRVSSETAIVGRDVHVSRHARGHRIVSFVDPETGYRAFKLENLENVGRKVDLNRIKQEILASLMREQKRAERGKAA